LSKNDYAEINADKKMKEFITEYGDKKSEDKIPIKEP